MEPLKEQIIEDIKLIKDQFLQNDSNLNKDEFAFHYWVLGRIYNIDDEYIPDQIVEYRDYGIDCYVHYEDSKELFIIQNKFYDESTSLDRKLVTDFLQTPLSKLKNGNYKRKKELQDIFDKAIIDSEYKIWLHFYVTNNNKNDTINKLFHQFNIDNVPNEMYKCMIQSKIFYLNDIYDLYYGRSFKEDQQFIFKLQTRNKGTILRILPKEYSLTNMSQAYYIMTPVSVIYKMYKQALEKQYPLFEKNIREYLGRNIINNGIMKTLKDDDDRYNFFYYNNGITMICEKATQGQGKGFTLEVSKPQIVNGCQTVNTIYEVLHNYEEKDANLIDKIFENVYVMVKVLVYNDEIKESKPTFYKDIVRYTNSQNAINEKAFASDENIFNVLQREFNQRGFLILVKPSDKNKFKDTYKDKRSFNKLITLAKKYTNNFNIDIKTLSDITIPLEKLLQVYLAFMKDGYYAYSKKSSILKSGSEYYQNYSLKMNDYFTFDNLLILYLLFKKAEIDKSTSDDKKTPIPFYLIGFLGYFIKNKDYNSINNCFKKIYSMKQEEFQKLYDFLRDLTYNYKTSYHQQKNEEYNMMIKQKIDIGILSQQVELLTGQSNYKDINKIIEALN
jgi:hypothetical protein